MGFTWKIYYPLVSPTLYSILVTFLGSKQASCWI